MSGMSAQRSRTFESCPAGPARASAAGVADLFGTGPQQLLLDAEGGVSYRPGFVGVAKTRDLVGERISLAFRVRPSRNRGPAGTVAQ